MIIPPSKFSSYDTLAYKFPTQVPDAAAADGSAPIVASESSGGASPKEISGDAGAAVGSDVTGLVLDAPGGDVPTEAIDSSPAEDKVDGGVSVPVPPDVMSAIAAAVPAAVEPSEGVWVAEQASEVNAVEPVAAAVAGEVAAAGKSAVEVSVAATDRPAFVAGRQAAGVLPAARQTLSASPSMVWVSATVAAAGLRMPLFSLSLSLAKACLI